MPAHGDPKARSFISAFAEMKRDRLGLLGIVAPTYTRNGEGLYLLMPLKFNRGAWGEL